MLTSYNSAISLFDSSPKRLNVKIFLVCRERLSSVLVSKNCISEMEAAGNDVETEQTDPDCYAMDASPGIEDMDGFENEMNNSSGVSFEELSEGGRCLAKEDMSPPEMDKAARVLDRVDGTDLFRFILISDSFLFIFRANPQISKSLFHAL